MTKIFSELPKETALYRYLDLKKFESLLSSQALYLAAMSSFDDKLEGSLSLNSFLDVSNEPLLLDHIVNNLMPSAKIETPEERENNNIQNNQISKNIESRTFKTPFGDFKCDDIEEFFNKCKKHIFVSCWHTSDHECSAMWKLYGGKNSICIKTNINNLSNGEGLPQFHYSINKVNYINYDECYNFESSIDPFISKYLPYKFEKESRLIAFNPNQNIKEEPLEHLEVKYNLNNLIEELIISPEADKSFTIKVRNLCEKYGIEPNKVHDSQLQKKPIMNIYDL